MLRLMHKPAILDYRLDKKGRIALFIVGLLALFLSPALLAPSQTTAARPDGRQRPFRATEGQVAEGTNAKLPIPLPGALAADGNWPIPPETDRPLPDAQGALAWAQGAEVGVEAGGEETDNALVTADTTETLGISESQSTSNGAQPPANQNSLPASNQLAGATGAAPPPAKLSLSQPAPSPSPATATWQSTAQAWIYPGEPACQANREYKDGRRIAVLKPEYYSVTTDGQLRLLTVQEDGCNAYSAANAADVKRYSTQQFVTVSAGSTEMRALVGSTNRRGQAVTTLSNFVSSIGFTGVELDFEGFGQWSASDYTSYKTFLRELADQLHGQGKQLMIDGPPIGTSTEQGYYQWRYEELATLPVDWLVVMAYDYQYDYGVGQPIAPNTWVKQIIRWAKARVPAQKLVIGLPSYGYHGQTSSYNVIIDTLAQTRLFSGFGAAQRDANSAEMKWSTGGQTFFFQDSTGLNAKRALIESEGISAVSVWHLGGNPWFSGKSER